MKINWLVLVALSGCRNDANPTEETLPDNSSEGTSVPTLGRTSAPRSEPWSGPLNGEVITGPLPVPSPIAFLSAPEFSDCVHPGVKIHCSEGWCRIPSGCFVFGSREGELDRAALDENQARITLTHDFEIQQTEVTLAEWEQAELFDFPNLKFGLEGSGPCEDPNCPVSNATWYQALQHANWLSIQRDLEPCYRVYDCNAQVDGFCSVELLAPTVYECEGYRLPTSAEWEYSTRAGTTTTFYSGSMSSFEHNDWCNWDPNLVRVAWYCANVPTMKEQPVAQLLPNGWGLYDVLGNVDEYTWDAARGRPMTDPSIDPAGDLDIYGDAVTRSCQVNDSSLFCRSAASLFGSRHSGSAGFRLVRTLGVGTLPTLADVPSTDDAR